MPTWRHSSPLLASANVAATIWLGAARNSALATMTRLANSQTRSPATTDSVPAIGNRRVRSRPFTPFCASTGRCTGYLVSIIDHLRHARQEQPVDREIGRHVAKLAQRLDDGPNLVARNLPGRLEQALAAQEVVRTLDVLLPGIAMGDHELDGFLAMAHVLEPGDALADCGEEPVDDLRVGGRPDAVYR